MTECGSSPPMPPQTVNIGGHTITLPPRLLPTPRASLEARRAECKQQEIGSEKRGELLGGSRGRVRSPRGCFWDFPNESPVRTRDDGICPESLRRRIRADFADCLSDDEIEEAIHRADKRFNEEALRAAGNAIVPQVAYEIIRGIVEIERGEHFPDVRKEADKV